MGNESRNKHTDAEVKEALQNNGKESAAAKIQEYLDEGKNVPLNIAITGQSGSGKSSFINAIRGIGNNEEVAVPAGVKETTMKVTSYLHPALPNVKLWDLPDAGSTNYSAANYLKMDKFENYDFFIIISAGRLTENDVNLAKEIQKIKKKFYFVRSKIDRDIRNAKEDQMGFNEEETLTTIRNDCIRGLQEAGFESPQVFLVSSKKLQLYDFHQLQETLERELPDHKKDAFLLAMPNISLEMINSKKKAFQIKIKYISALPAAVAAVPVPGLSVGVDLAVLVFVITWYVFGFGLDIKSLKRMANYSGVPYEELRAVITSPPAAVIITTEVILVFSTQICKTVVLLVAQHDIRFILILRIPTAMGLSLVFSYKSLNMLLDMLALGAEKVFQRIVDQRPQTHNE